MTLRSVCSGSSDESKSTSVVHESPGVQTDDTLEGRSTTHGQTDVDHDSDEDETSRQEQYHETDPKPDAAAARWTDKVASTSTDHQPHDSTVGEQGDASTTEGQTNVV